MASLQTATCPRCRLRAAAHRPGRCLDAWIAELLGWREVAELGSGIGYAGLPPHISDEVRKASVADVLAGKFPAILVPCYSSAQSPALDLIAYLSDGGMVAVRFDKFDVSVAVNRNGGTWTSSQEIQMSAPHRAFCEATAMAAIKAMTAKSKTKRNA